MKILIAILFGAAGVLGASQSLAAATPAAKAAYHQARDAAAAEYALARARCKSLAGNPNAVCEAEAKAQRVRADEEATAFYKNTLKAYTTSRLRIASATFELDKVKCAALAGNERDVCVKQAKATLIAAHADAKADKKAIEARANARDDKRDADYAVAKERCDAFSGVQKDNCVSAAKAQFSQ
ncbi:hypothetical protein [Massilia glaciei]|uniref:Cell envelope biogenesis protein TolA n=1 Tax=Massilia glaciei TaxID=1524097 RepID=A0A2U2HEE3_9BURK|nr:hypothetical protein [Massilia glaciei]PWF41911.1 hypothetical protein C7C56_023675 [Massilia glaciei]